ncbi:MAG TPA: histidine phosphatase family protein [Caulobacteraceae bacterium]|nr:histidine phosphatase family protein [Caulobacteraceae bacterium]
MARVILVRHCESESNRGGPEGGGSNSPLSVRGREQAEAVREAFASAAARDPTLRRSTLICSHLARAVDTAAAIGAALDIVASLDPRLGAGETLVGRYDLDDPATLKIVGAQVLAALSERTHAGADPLVAVSHRYPIWALLTVLYGDRGTAIMDQLNNLGNGDRLELDLIAGASPSEPAHRPLNPI